MSERCIICGKADAKLWTIDNLTRVTVTYLCTPHAAPLVAIMDAAEDLPPAQQRPLPDRKNAPVVEAVPTPSRGRVFKLEPLDWTPPS